MKDERDLLDRVKRVLRERHDGQEATHARTRERILASVRKQNKRRSFWLKGSIPGGILLLGTTAWAQATHQWPAVWRTLGDILSLPLISEGNGEQEPARARAKTSQSGGTRHTAPPPSSAAIEPTSEPSTDVAPTEELGTEESGAEGLGTQAQDPAMAPNASLDRPAPEQSAPPVNRQRKQATSKERTGNHPTPAPESTHDVEARAHFEPPSEPEIAAFRKANDLDLKQHDLNAALAAYRAYVRDYPNGRFVPEARYNSALILVKLGRREDARRALTPFASGSYGPYRQARAAKLLEALEQSAPTSAQP